MTQLQDVGSARSPERLALLRALARRRTAPNRIPRRTGGGTVGGPVPASYAQTRLWLVSQLEQGASAYHVPLPVRLRGTLDATALAAALSAVVRRHEALRTTFREDDEHGLLQTAQPPRPVDLPLTDLSGLPGTEREGAVRGHLADEQTAPFDLTRAPLLRARLLRLAPDDHLLLATVHHIGFDGWSVPLLHRELAEVYNARVGRRAHELPEPPLQYADYAVWQRERLRGTRLEELLGYWERRLAGAPPMELPTDRPVSDVTSTRGGTRSVELPRAVMERLGEIAKEEGASLFMTFAAVLGVLFQRFTGQDDVVLGTTTAGREQSELHALIGFFNNTFVVRSDLSGDPGFRELLRRTRTSLVADYAHSELPFDLLVDRLRPPRAGNRTPFFRVHFQVEEAAGALSGYEELPAYDGLRAEGLVPEFVTAKFDLGFTLRAAADGSVVDLVYSSDLFDDVTAEGLLAQVRGVVEAVGEEPDRGIGELPLPELVAPVGASAAVSAPAVPSAPATPGGPGTSDAPDEAAVARVLAVWREVLGREEIGPHEDFFDLGGNSFAAIKVRRLLDGAVPMVELFRHRTVHALAARLSGPVRGGPVRSGLFHELTPPGRAAELTLVCVPYAGGNATAYQPLADALPGRFALWAASLPGHEGGGPEDGLLGLTEATGRLADEIQERIAGPLIVYGHCAGASQAVDLARELEERGSPIRAVYLGGSLTDPDAAASLPRVTDSADDELHGYIRAIGGFDGPLDDTDLRHVLRALRHDMADATRFQLAAHTRPPRRLTAPVRCVLGDADPATPDFGERYRGWELFAESVSLDVLEGAGHYFIRDRAGELAGIVERREREAGRTVTGERDAAATAGRSAGVDDRSGVVGSEPPTPHPWQVTDDHRQAAPTAATPVVCLPHAGAGASFFQPWREIAGDRLEIIPLELPGREKRFAEEPLRTVTDAVDDLLPAVLRAAGGRSEVVLFGHCLGGVIAYELARRLLTETPLRVRRLVLSGAPGPLVPRERKATGLPDAEFLARVEELAGYRHPALEDPDMAELLLPALRADQEMYETYARTAVEPLDLPLTLLRGAGDTLVSAADMDQWQAVSTRAPQRAEFPGGHMYHVEHAARVLALLADAPAAQEGPS